MTNGCSMRRMSLLLPVCWVVRQRFLPYWDGESIILVRD